MVIVMMKKKTVMLTAMLKPFIAMKMTISADRDDGKEDGNDNNDNHCSTSVNDDNPIVDQKRKE